MSEGWVLRKRGNCRLPYKCLQDLRSINLVETRIVSQGRDGLSIRSNISPTALPGHGFHGLMNGGERRNRVLADRVAGKPDDRDIIRHTKAAFGKGRHCSKSNIVVCSKDRCEFEFAKQQLLHGFVSSGEVVVRGCDQFVSVIKSCVNEGLTVTFKSLRGSITLGRSLQVGDISVAETDQIRYRFSRTAEVVCADIDISLDHLLGKDNRDIFVGQMATKFRAQGERDYQTVYLPLKEEVEFGFLSLVGSSSGNWITIMW